MRSITIEQIDGKIRQALEYKRAEPIYHASGE
jgi:hypothetical protein